MKPYLTIPLLEVCNFRCVYCPPEGETYHTPKAVFSPEKVFGVLETAVAVGMNKVRFSGGEPLLYPHLQEVIQHATNLGLRVHMNTNGFLLLKHIDWLKQFPDLVVKVSLDAYGEETLKDVAKVSRIDHILDGIRAGVDAGIVRRLNFVLTRLNVADLPHILEFCGELGIALKIFDMYPVPETEQSWHQFFAPLDVLNLEGEPAPMDPYTQKFGTPTEERYVNGVHVRIKNCFNGTRYHDICQTCPFFPCPEGFYCLQVTPSLTVVPCRLGTHLYRACSDFAGMETALHEIMQLYGETYHANLFGHKYEEFSKIRLQELQEGTTIQVDTIPILGDISKMTPSTEFIRC